MRVLIVKTSSMGDVIHTLPAITDASCARSDLSFDWVIEESFAEIPAWHPNVDQAIPVALRRWRRNPCRAWRSGEWGRFKQNLRRRNYDLVIDAQCLMKSALLTRLVQAPRVGFDRSSAREPLAARAYDRRIRVSKSLHAVDRVRQLFAASLNYRRPQHTGDYGLHREDFAPGKAAEERIVFIHSTTRADKHWPETYWRELCDRLNEVGFQVRLPWGNHVEQARAERIALGHPNAKVLPRLALGGIAEELVRARAAVALDTGLGHLAAALDVPSVSLYGPTSPQKVGAYGRSQVHLHGDVDDGGSRTAPDLFYNLTPQRVFQALQDLLVRSGNGPNPVFVH